MKSASDCYKLSNGAKIPCIGFGTWQTPDGDVAVSSVKAAIAAGYTHIDTAAAYGNEEGIGKGIRESGIPRSELFIVTKLWNDDHGYDETKRAFEVSLKNLGLDYLDLYLIHWPNPIKFRSNWQKTTAESWKAIEELYEAGKIRAIGLSNFHERHYDALMQTAKIAPMVNQIRLCPGCTQDDVAAYSKKCGMIVEGYSPLGIGKLIEAPEMTVFAKKYGKSVAQVCIRWSLQQGYLPLPKSVTPSRIAENLNVFDFELSKEDIKTIGSFTGIGGTARNPDEIPF